LVSFFKISSFLFRILRNSIDEICILLGHGLFFFFPPVETNIHGKAMLGPCMSIQLQLIGNQIYLVSIEFTHFEVKKKHGPTIVFGIFVDDILLVYIPPPFFFFFFYLVVVGLPSVCVCNPLGFLLSPLGRFDSGMPQHSFHFRFLSEIYFSFAWVFYRTLFLGPFYRNPFFFLSL
jgi:hypothetical protein